MHREDEKIRFRDVQAQPRKIISSPTWSGIEDNDWVELFNVNGAIAARAVVSQRVNPGMAGAYGVYESGDWESIGEYYRFRNADLAGNAGTHTSWAAFWQIAHTWNERWTPYFRWEKAALDKSDPYFASLESARSYTRYLLGLRFNLNPKAALKIEAGRTRDSEPAESYTEARAQFAIRF